MAIGRMNISQTKHEKTNNFSESQADRTNPKLIRVNFSLLLLVFAKPAWTAVRINSPEDVNADAIVAAHALHANVSWKWQIKANGMLISASPCVYWGIGVAYFSHFRLIFRCEWKKWAFCDDFIIIVYICVQSSVAGKFDVGTDGTTSRRMYSVNYDLICNANDEPAPGISPHTRTSFWMNQKIVMSIEWPRRQRKICKNRNAVGILMRRFRVVERLANDDGERRMWQRSRWQEEISRA